MWHELAHNWAHWNNVPTGLGETLSPSHVLGEFICEVGTLILGILLGRPWRRLRKHDEKHTAEIQSMVDKRVSELLADWPPDVRMPRDSSLTSAVNRG